MEMSLLFHDSARDDSVEVDSRDLYAFAGGLHPEPLTAMRPSCPDPGGHPVSFRNLLFNGHMQVGIRPPNRNDVPLGSLDTAELPRGSVRLEVVWGDEIGQERHVSGVHDLLDVSSHKHLVLLFRRQGRTSRTAGNKREDQRGKERHVNARRLLHREIRQAEANGNQDR